MRFYEKILGPTVEVNYTVLDQNCALIIQYLASMYRLIEMIH